MGNELDKLTDFAGYDNSIEVYTDYRFSPPRPILYFRALPRYVSTGLYESDDNEVYYAKSGENETAFNTHLSGARKRSTTGYFILSAGPDRTFFTGDDIDNVGGG